MNHSFDAQIECTLNIRTWNTRMKKLIWAPVKEEGLPRPAYYRCTICFKFKWTVVYLWASHVTDTHRGIWTESKSFVVPTPSFE